MPRELDSNTLITISFSGDSARSLPSDEGTIEGVIVAPVCAPDGTVVVRPGTKALVAYSALTVTPRVLVQLLQLRPLDGPAVEVGHGSFSPWWSAKTWIVRRFRDEDPDRTIESAYVGAVAGAVTAGVKGAVYGAYWAASLAEAHERIEIVIPPYNQLTLRLGSGVTYFPADSWTRPACADTTTS